MLDFRNIACTSSGLNFSFFSTLVQSLQMLFTITRMKSFEFFLVFLGHRWQEGHWNLELLVGSCSLVLNEVPPGSDALFVPCKRFISAFKIWRKVSKTALLVPVVDRRLMLCTPRCSKKRLKQHTKIWEGTLFPLSFSLRGWTSPSNSWDLAEKSQV